MIYIPLNQMFLSLGELMPRIQMRSRRGSQSLDRLLVIVLNGHHLVETCRPQHVLHVRMRVEKDHPGAKFVERFCRCNKHPETYRCDVIDVRYIYESGFP